MVYRYGLFTVDLRSFSHSPERLKDNTGIEVEGLSRLVYLQGF
jgi:hypothetical protein